MIHLFCPKLQPGQPKTNHTCQDASPSGGEPQATAQGVLEALVTLS